MPPVDFSGNFWNVQNVKHMDIGSIEAPGAYEEKQGKTGTYTIFNMPVKVGNFVKSYSPSRETGNRAIIAWGENTDAWVGKKMQYHHVTKLEGGKNVTYLEGFPLA